jgi:hypothetical protein
MKQYTEKPYILPISENLSVFEIYRVVQLRVV